MGGACGMHETGEKFYFEILKRRDKTQLRRFRCKWEDDIKIALKETVGEVVDCICFSRYGPAINPRVLLC
jgi:hypothetical protein